MLTFTPSDRQPGSSGQTAAHIHVPDLPGWAWRKPGLVARGGLRHDLAESVGAFLLRAYHGSKFARWVMDKLQMAKLVFRTEIFNLPDRETMQTLLHALPDGVIPRVEAEHPVLIEVWDQVGTRQVHLVNYGPEPQQVALHLPSHSRGRVISPDRSEVLAVEGTDLSVAVDIYTILILE